MPRPPARCFAVLMNGLLVLACPPPDSVLWEIYLTELAALMLVVFPFTLLLCFSIAVGIHAGQTLSR